VHEVFRQANLNGNQADLVQLPHRIVTHPLNEFCAYQPKFFLQLLVHEHQSFDSATQITVTGGDDLVHILLVLVEQTIGMRV
jgi:hypothetical protein